MPYSSSCQSGLAQTDFLTVTPVQLNLGQSADAQYSCLKIPDRRTSECACALSFARPILCFGHPSGWILEKSITTVASGTIPVFVSNSEARRSFKTINICLGAPTIFRTHLRIRKEKDMQVESSLRHLHYLFWCLLLKNLFGNTITTVASAGHVVVSTTVHAVKNFARATAAPSSCNRPLQSSRLTISRSLKFGLASSRQPPSNFFPVKWCSELTNLGPV